ncbi:Dolichyl-phosphate-mannose-protein mannosyltransferase-domain-containing protein [Gaertneriomyces semiglobifer]|nr:Dolichyl-phosphate-mannose-protein mannosyltransferase-domain-containing protein [Gaertneriomyces semiglobifer]
MDGFSNGPELLRHRVPNSARLGRAATEPAIPAATDEVDAAKPFGSWKSSSSLLQSEYPPTSRKPHRPVNDANLLILIILTLLSAAVRLFRISSPSEVVFDEVHFGGFASKYINGKFFMDVHPPLGKLLISASAVLAGFDGSFDFKEIGMDYLKAKVPYVAMRMLPGVMGVLVAPLAYVTMRNLRASHASAALTALLLIFDNALALQSRLILLDSILVFFTALTAVLWTDFMTLQDHPFSFPWWFSLLMTGVAMALAASVKWVGLFAVALIGLSTIFNLWNLLGDRRISMTTFAAHFFARAACLIIAPILVYMIIFQLHFVVLTQSGTGNGFMSPEFQSTLAGSETADTFAHIGYGANIMLRHEASQGGYLHSHKHHYPTGSKQQQITLYPFTDENSLFKVLPALTVNNGSTSEPNITEWRRIKNGDIIRLEHVPTNKRLHSHDQPPPVSDKEHYYEVSGYGASGHPGDSNDHWRVEIMEGSGDKEHLNAIDSKFRLIHVNLRCALFSRDVKLPEWAFGQQEVICAKNAKKPKSLWRATSNENPLQPADSVKINYQNPGFLAKFFESHKVMWKINQGLTSSHPFESRPVSWPFSGRGISFWSSKSGQGQLYLVGNPLVWFPAIASVGMYLSIVGAAAVLKKRAFATISNLLEGMSDGGGFAFLGWLLHYFPFFLMGRQLFLHHYLPSLYFSVLLLGILFDRTTSRMPSMMQYFLAICAFSLTSYLYISFSPLTYGLPMDKQHCESLKWRESWDWNCGKSTNSTLPSDSSRNI